VHARLTDVVGDEPVATKYDVVVDLATSGSCCGGGGHGSQRGNNEAAVDAGVEQRVAGGCCQGA